MYIVKNYMESLPEAVEESAMLDGAGNITILTRIVLPMSLPVLATMTLFYAVGYWNSYFSSVLYTYKPEKYPLQRVLREFISSDMVDELNAGEIEVQEMIQPFTAKMAVIMIATLPVMCIYPFLQKYFMTGLVLGGVKE